MPADAPPPPGAAWTDARFRAMTQHSGDIISLLDAEGRLLYNSPSAERISGFSAAELQGASTFDFIHPDDRAAVAETFRAVLARPGEPLSVQYRYRAKAGGWTWMEAVACNHLGNPAVRGVVATSRDITDRKRIEQALQESEGRLRALASRMSDAIEESQRRMGRDLHDDLAQVLTGLKLDLTRLERRLVEEGAPAWLEDGLVSATAQVDLAHASVRRIAAGLRPAGLDALGLGAALASEAGRFETRAGVRCRLALEEVPGLEPEAVTALFRIAQEALTNVARHAGAAEVTVSLAAEGPEVVLRVEDDGRGPGEACPAGGLGLLGMSERAARLGGTSCLLRRAAGGACVETRLPRRAPAPALP